MENVKIGAAHQDGNLDAPLSKPLLYESNSMNKLDSTRPCKKCGTSDRYASGICRACSKASSAAWRAANPERARANIAAWEAANSEHLKAMKSAYRIANFAKEKAANAAWNIANPGVKAKRAKAWRESNLERFKENGKAWINANLDKRRSLSIAWNKENPEKIKASQLKWHAANPGYSKIAKHTRRARVRDAAGTISKGLEKKLFKLQKGRCACCKQPLGDDYHMDHIMPLVLGGSNSDENIQLLRSKCNLQKNAKHPVDFMQSRGYLL